MNRSVFVVLAAVAIVVLAVLSDSCLAAHPTGLFTLSGKIRLVRDESQVVQILVNGGQSVGFVERDGTFKIPNLAAGSYSLEISSPSAVYPKFRYDILSGGKIRAARVLDHTLVPLASASAEIFPIRPKEHFPPVTGFSLWSMLSGGSMMMILPMLILPLMLKGMQKMDPDMMKQMEQQMEGQQRVMSQISAGDLSGAAQAASALTSDDSAAQSASTTTTTTASIVRRKRKN